MRDINTLISNYEVDTMDRTVNITLDLLDQESCFVVKETQVLLNGQTYTIGHYRTAYKNSPEGKIMIKQDLPEAYANAVFSVWETKGEI